MYSIATISPGKNVKNRERFSTCISASIYAWYDIININKHVTYTCYTDVYHPSICINSPLNGTIGFLSFDSFVIAYLIPDGVLRISGAAYDG